MSRKPAYVAGGRPNPDFWMGEVWAGIEYRKKYTSETAWPRWRDYYRGNFRPGILPLNIFFMLMRTIVPRVYFRNPSVSITPQIPGPLGIAFAQVLERVDNKLMTSMKMKKELKRIVQQTFMFGTGVGKLGFGAQFTPTPEFGFTAEPVGPKGERVEYRDGVYANMPWFACVHPRDFIVPDGIENFEDARWLGHWIRRPFEDVIADKRLNTKDLKGSFETNPRVPLRYGKMYTQVDMVDLVEIRDKKNQKVIVLAPYGGNDGKVLYFGDDELQANNSLPLYPLIFNEDDEVCWGVPDSRILEPQQLEINEIKTQMMRHRRMALVKWLVRKKGMDPEEAQKMISEDVVSIIFTEENPNNTVMQLQASNIPPEIRLAAQEVMQDVREGIGFSRNQFGEYNSRSGDTTATEANIVRMASEIRVDERRDQVADMIVNVINDMHYIIFNHWGQKQVIEVVGPGGYPVWVSFTGEVLRSVSSRYITKIDPDTSVPETKQLREQKAIQLYSILKENPMIDPMKLTQYLLHELHGIQFDDMIRMLPPVDNMPQEPIGVQDYGNMIQQSMASIPQRGLTAIQGGRQ